MFTCLQFYNVMVFYHSVQLLKYTPYLNMIFYSVDVLELCVLNATNKLTGSDAKPYSALKNRQVA